MSIILSAIPNEIEYAKYSFHSTTYSTSLVSINVFSSLSFKAFNLLKSSIIIGEFFNIKLSVSRIINAIANSISSIIKNEFGAINCVITTTTIAINNIVIVVATSLFALISLVILFTPCLIISIIRIGTYNRIISIDNNNKPFIIRLNTLAPSSVNEYISNALNFMCI